MDTFTYHEYNKEFKKIYQGEKVAMFKDNFDLYKKLDANKDLNEYVQEKMFEFLFKKAFEEKSKI